MKKVFTWPLLSQDYVTSLQQLSVVLRSLSNVRMGRRKTSVYWKYLGKALNQHDDVINMHGKLRFQYKCHLLF